MKNRKGVKNQNSTSGSGGSRGGKPNLINSTPHGLKGPKRKKPLPPWHEVRDQIK